MTQRDTARTLPPFALTNFGAYFKITCVYANVEDRNDIPGIEALNDAVLKADRYLYEATRFRHVEFTDADFERLKRKFIGSFVRSFNSLEFIASEYTAYKFHRSL